MLTISHVAKRFELSRSTLLYYDRIGLLSPSARSEANYRLYDSRDLARMEMISVYRRAGLSLADIARVFSSGSNTLPRLLDNRLRELNEEIGKLRQQQLMIAKLLNNDAAVNNGRVLDKAGWVGILKASGLNEQDRQRWHIEFERLSPDGHHDFLLSLGIAEREVREIRAWARENRHRKARSRRSRQTKPGGQCGSQPGR